jgi:hypothetical protein
MVALDHVMGLSWYQDNKDDLRDEYETDEIRRLMSWSDFLASRYTAHVNIMRCDRLPGVSLTTKAEAR